MRKDQAVADFLTVTEVPGSGATREQLAMLYTRYHLAATFCGGRDVLEVACGSGIGLGYLAKRARYLVGGDYDWRLLQHARARSQDAVRLLHLDAHALPFGDRSFDVVILFEALYYLSRPDVFVAEARRILRSGGTLLICTANRECKGFAPSSYAKRYFSGTELSTLLERAGFKTEIYGAFKVPRASGRDRFLLTARRVAVTLRLIPPTLRSRGFLKRLVYGKLSPIPDNVRDGMSELGELIQLGDAIPAAEYKVLYAIGQLSQR